MTDTSSLVSQEAEEAVIGSVLVSGNEIFDTLRDVLYPRHFFLVRLRVFWQAFARIADAGGVIDMTSVVGELESMGEFDPMRDYGEIVRLTQIPSNSMHAGTYARLVRRLAGRRDALKAVDELRADLLNEAISTETAIGRLDKRAADLQREMGAAEAHHVTMDAFTDDLYFMLGDAEKQHAENPNHVVGIRTGVRDLDLMLDGLQPGVITLAAATGLGKTTLALQIVRFAAQRGLLRAAPAPAKVHFFSGEMTQRQLGVRMLASMTGIPARHIQRGSYSAAQKEQIIDAMGLLQQATSLTLEPGARVNTAQLRQRVRMMVQDNAMDLLVLDGLLQIEGLKIDPRDSTQRQSYVKQQRRDLIEEIMGDLEALTLAYKIPILMTHQISRAPAGRADKRPILSDLAEASFVEQKSAVILFLHREGYYTRNADDTSAEIICAKNRFGGSGTVNIAYDAQRTRFLNPGDAQ